MAIRGDLGMQDERAGGAGSAVAGIVLRGGIVGQGAGSPSWRLIGWEGMMVEIACL